MVFDIMSIVPYIKQYGFNPVTGNSLKQGDLFKLNFHKNEEGEYHCPVTYKILSNSTHIVAIKESGNVYSYEAYFELNKQAKNYRDLLTDEKFDPKTSVVLLNDPKCPNLIRHQKVNLPANHS